MNEPDPVRVDLPAVGPDGAPVDGVALVTIDRPPVNALGLPLIGRLVESLERLDADAACRCIVLTGAGRAFSAGADIREMAAETAPGLLAGDPFSSWDRIARMRKPIVAAVRGYAFGGGCELAMACDMIVAADDAVFGQPEVKLGIIPGVGGTQRLTRALGKAKAMELILTGANLPAREAEARGLVTRVVPPAEVVGSALELAGRIAAMPPLAVLAAKEAVNAAFQMSLEAGVARERRLFYLLFASEDRAEGMRAFLEKRSPEWKGR